jgi:hypothetical protein
MIISIFFKKNDVDFLIKLRKKFTMVTIPHLIDLMYFTKIPTLSFMKWGVVHGVCYTNRWN